MSAKDLEDQKIHMCGSSELNIIMFLFFIVSILFSLSIPFPISKVTFNLEQFDEGSTYQLLSRSLG